MTSWRRAVALATLVIVGLLGPSTALAKCCRGVATQTCCCPRGETPDVPDRLARACCRPAAAEVIAPVGLVEIVDLLAAPAVVASPAPTVAPRLSLTTIARAEARARAPDRPLWLSLRSLRC